MAIFRPTAAAGRSPPARRFRPRRPVRASSRRIRCPPAGGRRPPGGRPSAGGRPSPWRAVRRPASASLRVPVRRRVRVRRPVLAAPGTIGWPERRPPTAGRPVAGGRPPTAGRAPAGSPTARRWLLARRPPSRLGAAVLPVVAPGPCRWPWCWCWPGSSPPGQGWAARSARSTSPRPAATSRPVVSRSGWRPAARCA